MLIFSPVINPIDIEQKEKTLLEEWHLLATYGDKTLSLCLKGCLYKVKKGNEEWHTYNRKEAINLFNKD